MGLLGSCTSFSGSITAPSLVLMKSSLTIAMPNENSMSVASSTRRLRSVQSRTHRFRPWRMAIATSFAGPGLRLATCTLGLSKMSLGIISDTYS